MVKGNDEKYIKNVLFPTRRIAYYQYLNIPLKKGSKHVSERRFWSIPLLDGNIDADIKKKVWEATKKKA